MKRFSKLKHWRVWRRSQPVWAPGFVPTMGGLHAGHRALIKRSLRENEVTVVSLFVNPTQFDHAGDLQSYPADREADLALLERWGVQAVLLPEFEDLYADDYRYRVSEDSLSKKWCGAHRPGHFDGVLTVVMRLFNLVQPRRAYFGEKDLQQLRLIQGMVDAFFLDLDVIPCATVREPDGLALSSRNARLDESQRRQAAGLYATLKQSLSAPQARTRLSELGFKVEYVEDIAGRRLAAVQLGDVRLIDNVELQNHA